MSNAANALKIFYQWCNNEEVDYLSSASGSRVPTYLFKEYLLERMNPILYEKTLAKSTAEGYMSHVVNFYRWLQNEMNIEFRFPLYREMEKQISYTSSYGITKYKLVVSTDVQNFPNELKNNQLENTIDDGENLRPMSEDEQIKFIDILEKAPITYQLIGLLSLFTGARLQTVCTFKIGNFTKDTHDKSEQDEIDCKVGAGTIVDTKFDKRFTLYIPVWLYRKVQMYIDSPQAKKYREKANIYKNPLFQYVFLSNRGKPFYLGKGDTDISSHKTPIRGNSVIQYFYKYITPMLKHPFKFHDLRATYGVNYVEARRNKDGKIFDESRVISNLRERMGHSDIKTTYLYLRYTEDIKTMNEIEDEFQNELMIKCKGL